MKKVKVKRIDLTLKKWNSETALVNKRFNAVQRTRGNLVKDGFSKTIRKIGHQERIKTGLSDTVIRHQLDYIYDTSTTGNLVGFWQRYKSINFTGNVKNSAYGPGGLGGNGTGTLNSWVATK